MKKIKINRSIFSKKAIEATMAAYRDHAVTTVSYRPDYAFVTFWKCRYDEELTIKEFENYLIGIENA